MDNNIRISQGAAYFESDQSVVFQFVGLKISKQKIHYLISGGLVGTVCLRVQGFVLGTQAISSL